MSENLNLESLTGAKQSMSAWTKVIESYEDVPTVYKGFFEKRLTDNQTIPYTLLAPPLIKPAGTTTEKLICDADNAIHILERNGSKVIIRSYPYQTVSMLEMGNVLLGSWMTISGVAITGMAGISTIDFNDASSRHYEAFIKKLRPLPRETGGNQFMVQKDKFDYLSANNFKLMSYARASLVDGETVQQIILQPEIRKPRWSMLGDRFLKMVTPPHLTILTSHELIFIEDIGGGSKAGQPKYGGIGQYIPLRSIKSMAWSKTTDGGWLTLSITTSPERIVSKIYAISNKPELEQLCAEF
jgi:hypothetical protein